MLWGLLGSRLSLGISNRTIVFGIDFCKHLDQVVQLVLVRELDDHLVVLGEILIAVLFLQLNEELAILRDIWTG